MEVGGSVLGSRRRSIVTKRRKSNPKFIVTKNLLLRQKNAVSGVGVDPLTCTFFKSASKRLLVFLLLNNTKSPYAIACLVLRQTQVDDWPQLP